MSAHFPIVKIITEKIAVVNPFEPTMVPLAIPKLLLLIERSLFYSAFAAAEQISGIAVEEERAKIRNPVPLKVTYLTM